MHFQQMDLLQGLDKNFIKQFLDISEKETHDEGTFIFHQGDRANFFYILLKGSVKLKIGDLGHLIHVVDQAGSSFGWSSVMERNFYSSSAECILPTKVIKVEKEKCLRFLAGNPESGMMLFQRFTSMIGERLISTYERMPQVSAETLLFSYDSDKLMDMGSM